MYKRMLFSLALILSVICSFVNAQECAPPKIVVNAKSNNLFSPEQEMILGDLIIQREARTLHIVRDDKLLAYINEIGERLIRHLPPTGLKFQFHLIDLQQNNAFNIAGGHIFISRKLIAFTKNEDELAGVMAHELGHATVHHQAVDISNQLRSILNVTELGDRKDITEKYNLLMERYRTRKYSTKSSLSDDHQLEADKIGVFAMVAAGYDPAAFSSFFDRLAETEGKTGNWFSNLFGSIRPDEKRLREMVHLTASLPVTCREGRTAKTTDDYLKWQADIVSFRDTGRKEELPGLVWKKELSSKLRSDITHLAFSKDGKYLLAQDDFSITIIARESLQPVFQIPVENADDAIFTVDGKYVLFTTIDLKYEKWSIEEKKPIEMRNLAIRRDCFEHKISPDGNYLACIDTATTINILEVKTSKKVWEMKKFYPLSAFEFLTWLESGNATTVNNNFFRIQFTPDSHYVMFSRSEKYRFRISINGLTAGSSEDTALALELPSFKTVGIGGDIKKLSSHAYLFLDSETILGLPGSKVEDGGLFSFPSGKRIQRFPFYAKELNRTPDSNYIVVKPVAKAMMGVMDLKKGVVVAGLNKRDAAVWNNVMAYEAVNGRILVREISYNETAKGMETKDVGTVDIPVSTMSNLNTVEVSDNFNWLVFSSKTRGGLWDLQSGQRKLYVRGFRSSIVANDGEAVGDFPKFEDTNRSLVLMDPNKNSVDPISEINLGSVRQYGRFVMERIPLRLSEKKTQKRTPEDSLGAEDEDYTDLSQSIRMEIKDLVQNKVVWTREFPKEVPSYSFDKVGGRLFFYWNLASDAGKAMLKESPDLQTKANSLSDKGADYIVEIVDILGQKTIGSVIIDTGNGSFIAGAGHSMRDWLLLHDDGGRVLVYSIKNGDLQHRFFGRNALIDPKKDLLAVENFPGEITLYDLNTEEPVANFVINGRTTLARFNADGDKLFVLSDSQSAYVFDLNKAVATSAAAIK